MKKKFSLLAVVGIALASCSSDETVQSSLTSDSNAISFRTSIQGTTRAADINATTLQTSGFKAFARVYGVSAEGANYFPETQFSWDAASGSYVSTNKYYWPSTGALNFYAWQASNSGQVTHTAAGSTAAATDKQFTVTPAALDGTTTAAGQTDLVFANVNNQGKGAVGASGVAINFRHAEAKVIMMIKNTNPNLKFTVGKVEIGNLYGSGTYTYPGDGTSASISTAGSGTLDLANWAQSGTQDVDYSLTMKSDASYNVLSGTTAAKAIVETDNEMILIPQNFLVSDVYASASSGAVFEGSYISAEIKVQNPTNDAYIVGSADAYVKAIWPLPAMSINPGYKYTFTVDLAGGGYYAVNQDTDSDLDPILEGSEIRFVTVTVDGWDDGGTNIIGNVVKGGTYTFNEAADAAGTYYIVVSGLTSGSTLAASLTTAGNLSELSIVDNTGNALATTPASGVARIKVTLAANSSAAISTGTISFTESGSATTTTTINIVQAAE